jgi:hypothetical protein
MTGMISKWSFRERINDLSSIKESKCENTCSFSINLKRNKYHFDKNYTEVVLLSAR